MFTPRALRSASTRGRRLILPAVAGLALAGTLTAAARPPAVPATASITGFLHGVSAVSASDVWAVGWGQTTSPTIAHWNGTAWSSVKAPAKVEGVLNSVSMVSATDGWAVGWTSGVRPFRYLILHWNGKSWQYWPITDAPSNGDDELYSVSMVSATDGWIVGNASAKGGGSGLVLHWNGTTWTQAYLEPDSTLEAVSAASASDAWATGTNSTGLAFAHWNGTTWSSVPVTSSSPQADVVNGVADAPGTNAWAVGMGSGDSGPTTLALSWNGTSWTQAQTPSPGHQDPSSNYNGNELGGVDIISSSNVWAAGDYTTSKGAQAVLFLHWNGSQWAQAPSQGATSDSVLHGIVMISPTDGWAVGGGDFTTQALIMHWNGTTWSPSS
jgi:hypothetical protein